MVAGVFVGAIFGFVYLVSLLFARPRNGHGQEKTGTEDDEATGGKKTRSRGTGEGGPDGDSP
jgi:hypothetical protein